MGNSNYLSTHVLPMTTPPSPGSNGRGGFVGALVDKLLAYIDRPWRAIFVLALILVGGIGYTVYENRSDLLRVLVAHGPPAPVSLRSDLGAVLTSLLITTSADAIGIWAVDLGANRADLNLAQRRNDGAWPAPEHLQWVTEYTDWTVKTKLFNGEEACGEPAALGGVLASYLATDGMIYACYVPEPPSRSEPTIGVVVLAWRTAPDARDVRRAVAAVQAQTEKIIMR